jgi:hypothetical protein
MTALVLKDSDNLEIFKAGTWHKKSERREVKIIELDSVKLNITTDFLPTFSN